MANRPFTTATIAGKEYKLRLSALACVQTEKALGKSVLDVLLAMSPKGTVSSADLSGVSVSSLSMPFLGDLLTIIHGSMQKYQHGTSLKDVYDLYEDHIDQGGSYEDFIPILTDILAVSGFLPKAAQMPQETERPTEPQGTAESIPAVDNVSKV